MTDDLEAATQKLIITVRSLNEAVRRADDLRGELDDLVAQSRKNRRLIVAVSVGLVLEVILTAVVIFSGLQTQRNTDRIDSIVRTQHDVALCPLYKLFIDADTPANRDRAAAQGQDVAERGRQFAIIRRSYEALRCEGQ